MLSRRLQWAREIQSIAQTGLSYAPDPYDVERYIRLRSIAAEMMSSGDLFEIERLETLFATQVGHATPKIDVRATIFQNDTILLVQGTDDGAWSLPGGWADPGESPSEAIAREVHEESGYTVAVNRLLALYDRDRHPHPAMEFHVYILFFDCAILGGSRATSSETSDVRFFPVADLPPLSLTRVLPQQIDRLFHLHQHLEMATEFD
ncbi:MAG TPA: NUDIX hydrolase [Nitrolancea sp.]|nr:NUDIX hydrolase [Nitrolancea sp.]